jgi:hypothetical protein
MADLTDGTTPPLQLAGVEKAISQLRRELLHLLGAGTEFCVVVAQDTPDLVHVQAMTNTSALRAKALLRIAAAADFDVVN